MSHFDDWWQTEILQAAQLQIIFYFPWRGANVTPVVFNFSLSGKHADLIFCVSVHNRDEKPNFHWEWSLQQTWLPFINKNSTWFLLFASSSRGLSLSNFLRGFYYHVTYSHTLHITFDLLLHHLLCILADGAASVRLVTSQQDVIMQETFSKVEPASMFQSDGGCFINTTYFTHPAWPKFTPFTWIIVHYNYNTHT